MPSSLSDQADVETLYKNINVHTAIQDVLQFQFAKENSSFIKKYGVQLCDLQEFLETTLGESYFVYNRKVYLQLLGLFMATNSASIVATVKMWNLERCAIFTWILESHYQHTADSTTILMAQHPIVAKLNSCTLS